MKFKIERYKIRIEPENDQDVAFVEDTLGLRHEGDMIALVRHDAFKFTSLAYVDTPGPGDLSKDPLLLLRDQLRQAQVERDAAMAAANQAEAKYDALVREHGGYPAQPESDASKPCKCGHPWDVHDSTPESAGCLGPGGSGKLYCECPLRGTRPTRYKETGVFSPDCEAQLHEPGERGEPDTWPWVPAIRIASDGPPSRKFRVRLASGVEALARAIRDVKTSAATPVPDEEIPF